MDYKFGTKANWRRWAWNRIAELVPERRSARVLYLPGPDDFDRPIARSKGFLDKNMIGVELDGITRERLRKKGVRTVDGNINDVVLGWPMDQPIGVCFFDYCHGLEARVFSLIPTLMNAPNFMGCAFCFNFMRGRDQSSNDLRLLCMDSLRAMGFSGDLKHRGYFFFKILASVVRVGSNALESDEFVDVFLRRTRPKFYSYKSSTGQVFDSVVFHSLYKSGELAGICSQAPDYFNSWSAARQNRTKALHNIAKAARSAAAVKATLTREYR